jgi:hypothetical protein
VHEHKRIDGKKNSFWLNMKWNGLHGIFYIGLGNGRQGLKTTTRNWSPAQRLLQLGKLLNGIIWRMKPNRFLFGQIRNTGQTCD